MIAGLAVLVTACSGDGGAAPSGPAGGSVPVSGAPAPGTTAPAYPRDDELRLNQIQVLGSHNSYHIEPDQDVQDAINARFPRLTELWQYTHAPLPEQFDRSGVRQIELDVWHDPTGTRFCQKKVLQLVGRSQDPPTSGCDAGTAGFTIQHVQELDFNVTCNPLVACLHQVDDWSKAHPAHVPITILIEAKDGPAIPDPLNLGFVQPLPIGPAELDLLDAEIRSVFPPARLITPDSVRGTHPTLEAAVRFGTGWPTLGDARGKVLFLLDNAGKRADYTAGHPSLQGRVMFTNAQPGEPEAAFVERNDAVKSQGEIGDLVRQGYLVRTRADGDTKQARSGDTAAREAAVASGAQFVSTDYEVADSRFGHGFVVALPGGVPARCNPVVAPPGCRSSDIE